jgi:hypothetical protein
VPDKKEFLLFDLDFSSVPQNFTPFPKTTIFQINTHFFRFHPIIKQHSDWKFKIKNKKKESKNKFQVYKKASSSPTGF